MKRFLLLLAFVAILVPARAQAPADSVEVPASAFSMGAGLSLGLMDGVGVGLSFRIIEQLNVRVGYGMIPSFLIPEYGISVPELGSYPATTTAVTGKVRSSGSLLVDYHPGGKSFRVTAGLFFGSKNLVNLYNTKALPEAYRSAGVKQTIREMAGSSSGKSYDRYADYVDKLRSLPVLPVARLSVFVKLF